MAKEHTKMYPLSLLCIAGGIVLSGSSSEAELIKLDIPAKDNDSPLNYKSSLTPDKSITGRQTARLQYLGGMIGTKTDSSGDTSGATLENCYSNCHAFVDTCHTDTVQQCADAGYTATSCATGYTTASCSYNSTYKKCTCYSNCHTDTIQQCTDAGYTALTSNDCPTGSSGYSLGSICPYNSSYVSCASAATVCTASGYTATSSNDCPTGYSLGSVCAYSSSYYMCDSCYSEAATCHTDCHTDTAQQCILAGYDYEPPEDLQGYCSSGYSLAGICPYNSAYLKCTAVACHTDTAQQCSEAGYTETSCDTGYTASTCSYNSSYKSCTCYSNASYSASCSYGSC